jgi:hypothetical protein
MAVQVCTAGWLVSSPCLHRLHGSLQTATCMACHDLHTDETVLSQVALAAAVRAARQIIACKSAFVNCVLLLLLVLVCAAPSGQSCCTPPLASAVDTELPTPPEHVRMLIARPWQCFWYCNMFVVSTAAGALCATSATHSIAATATALCSWCIKHNLCNTPHEMRPPESCCHWHGVTSISD